MKILILNGSPKGEYSITLQTLLYLQKRHPEHSFTTLSVGQKIRQLEKDFKKATTLPENATEEEIQDAELSVLDLTIFENVAWLMIRHAGEDVPDDPDEWLDTIDGVFSIYEVLPQILEMWEANLETTSVPRKK